MKLLFSVFLSAVTFVEFACAGGTPFDRFAGQYSILSGECRDYVKDSSFASNVKNISIISSEVEKEIRILKILENGRWNSTLDEDLGGRFSGDGVTGAKWSQSLKKEGFIYFWEDSISKGSAGDLTFSWEYKYEERRPNVPANNIHLRCELKLGQSPNFK
jgi:hypothetical protein